MDKNRFDGLTRTLAQRENRRQALKTLFAGGLGTAAAVVVGSEAEAAKTDCCPQAAPTLCNLTCTDTIYDEQNCGGCGVTCAAGERCYKSACESESIVHCATVADCPGANTECSTITCKKGICGVSYAANGKKTATQVAGDCQRNVCDGAGNVITIVDNTDKPTAAGLCYTGICVSGVPHQNKKTTGAKCATGKCDANGQCSGGGCLTVAECPPATNECQTAACLNGICGYEFAADGTETTQQTQGDCQKNVCDGNGNVVSINDDGDIPAPMYSGNCYYGVCANGIGEIVNEPAGTACNGGVCDGYGNCGALPNCFSDSDCPPPASECASSSCQGGNCIDVYASHGTPVSYQTQWDCQQNVCDGNGGIVSIPDDTDFQPPYYDFPCLGSICVNGEPQRPYLPGGSPCIGISGVCDGAGNCIDCFADTECPETGVPFTLPACIGGFCTYQCIEGWTECLPNGGGCVDTRIDPDHCGGCENYCESGWCFNSQCQ